MKSGYKILWTENAISELNCTYEYLHNNFSEKELSRLSLEIEKFIELISNSPNLFQKSDFKNVRRVIILKHNTMYYRENENTIEILSFFSNRQNPQKILFE